MSCKYFAKVLALFLVVFKNFLCSCALRDSNKLNMVHFCVSDTWQATKCTVLVLVLSKESQTFSTCKFQLPFTFWLEISCQFAVVVVFTIACINVPGRSVAMSVCLPDCLCLSVCLSVCPSTWLPLCVSVCLYVCLSVCPSVRPSVFYLLVVRPPYWWSMEPHQLGGYILGSVNVRKTFWRISKSIIGKDLKET